MGIRIGINGFGRIGRNVFRAMRGRKDMEVVAVNDLADSKTLAHLLRYDSVFGRYPGEIRAEEGALVVDGRRLRVLAEKDPAKLPWKEMEVSFAIESTGVFTKRADLEKHLAAGARRVVLTVPAGDPIDATIVMGVNQPALQPEHKLISNASCTTNCLAPLALVLHRQFGIVRGLMTTVHAYTNDQRILDLIHKDLRRARSAATNIIPTTTGAAKAVGEVIPELKGKLNGVAMRVPVPDGSIVDLVAEMAKDVTPEQVNGAMKAAAEGPLKGIVRYCDEPIVSSDIVGDAHSCVFDALSTMVIEKRMVKAVAWYDNEWGYSNRVVDLIAFAAGQG
ncbi:MAG: type I glyceraldehyde-3-phosphate dehydrogenase [Planctomycetales bacterium]|nr:type I glyceraldehyde-3-phosphate dehydrogenase [Planctomycetales bacterium]